MRVLVTGGLGFIGSALVSRLLAAGHRVDVVDSVTPQIHGENATPNIPDGVTFTRMDVRDLRDHPALVEGADAVYHLAAETGTAQSMYEISRYVDVNEGGTAALLEAIERCAVRPSRIILASSRSVYGEGAFTDETGHMVQAMPRSRQQLEAADWELRDAHGTALTPIATPETQPFAPGSIYAATKASQELLLAAAAQALGFSATILRLQNVYGEGQSLQNPYTGIISIFFNRARQGLGLPIYEDGRETRDFVHIDDVVTALLAALDRAGDDTLICNVGSGVATSVETLARTLLAAAGLYVPISVTGQFRLGDIRHNFADITRLRQSLGVTPTVALEQGLARFCAWAAEQPAYADRLEAATAELRAKGLAN